MLLLLLKVEPLLLPSRLLLQRSVLGEDCKLLFAGIVVALGIDGLSSYEGDSLGYQQWHVDVRCLVAVAGARQRRLGCRQP